MKLTTDDQMNLNEPHFDEEATLLAARPVVPLDEVRTTRRSKGGLALVLAIGGGLIIGLLVAALLFRYLGADQTAAVETTAATEQPPSQVTEPPSSQLPTSAGGVAVSVEEPAITSSDDKKPPVVEAEESAELEPDEPKTVRKPEPAPELETRPRIIVSEPRVSEEDEEEIERALRRAERQEERRDRRRAAREVRKQQRDEVGGNDDLSRIREIFEGTPRP